MGKHFFRPKERDYDLIMWENLITIGEASKLFNRAKRTITLNIHNGVFEEGIDCVKLGSTYVMDIRRLRAVYGDEEKEEKTEK